MKTLICTTNDDGSKVELEVEGAVRCVVRVCPPAIAGTAVTHAAQPDAAAIAEAEAVFAHLRPENRG